MVKPSGAAGIVRDIAAEVDWNAAAKRAAREINGYVFPHGTIKLTDAPRASRGGR